MSEEAIAKLSRLSVRTHGVFRLADATSAGVTTNQISRLVGRGVLERVLPRTYRLTAVARSPEQDLRAALLWDKVTRRADELLGELGAALAA